MQAARIWLAAPANPYDLPEPPQWWQSIVYDYDKMLRIFGSMKEPAYRLCRVVRREARLGLQAMVVHEHPDTRFAITQGVVPVATIKPWATFSNKILRDLAARDTWRLGGVEKIEKSLNDAEQTEKDTQQRQQDEHLDDINSSLYRAIRYGRPETFDIREAHQRQKRNWPRVLQPLAPPVIDGGLQNRVPSSPSPGDSPATGRIVLTDS